MSIDQIIDDFAVLDDWDERYRYIIDLGRKMAPFPDALAHRRRQGARLRQPSLAGLHPRERQARLRRRQRRPDRPWTDCYSVADLFRQNARRNPRPRRQENPRHARPRHPSKPATLERPLLDGRTHPRRRPRGDGRTDRSGLRRCRVSFTTTKATKVAKSITCASRQDPAAANAPYYYLVRTLVAFVLCVKLLPPKLLRLGRRFRRRRRQLLRSAFAAERHAGSAGLRQHDRVVGRVGIDRARRGGLHHVGATGKRGLRRGFGIRKARRRLDQRLGGLHTLRRFRPAQARSSPSPRAPAITSCGANAPTKVGVSAGATTACATACAAAGAAAEASRNSPARMQTPRDLQHVDRARRPAHRRRPR